MRVIGIACSPRVGGNTEILVREALDGAKEAGADEVEFLSVADKNIAPCDACDSCAGTGECRIEDDMQEIYQKLLAADGIILGTPVYIWSMCAQAKILMDRTYALMQGGRKLRDKVGGIIVVARRAGCTSTYSSLRAFFRSHGMQEARGAIAYGDKPGDVRRDEQGMREARATGRAVVRAIKGS